MVFTMIGVVLILALLVAVAVTRKAPAPTPAGKPVASWNDRPSRRDITIQRRANYYSERAVGQRSASSEQERRRPPLPDLPNIALPAGEPQGRQRPRSNANRRMI